MIDSRLLGVWRSDARRTRLELAARRDILARSRPSLVRLFGKIELTFTRTRCHSTFDGSTLSAAYRVLAKDASSVATIGEDGTISHIHFERSGFWINVGNGKFREFFKKVVPPNKRLQPTAARRSSKERSGRRG